MDHPFLFALVLGYLLGSIPTAYWLGLLVYKTDVFKHGSRNMGATNVYRILGGIPFAVTLSIDIMKGFLAVMLSQWYIAAPESLMETKIFAGAAALTGHTLSFWVGFKGGKGVATGLGVFLGLAPKASIIAMAVFLLILVISGFVSLGSIVGAGSLPFLVFYFKEGGEEWFMRLTVFSGFIATFIVFKHKANILRLIKGEELSLRSPKRASTPASSGEPTESQPQGRKGK